MNGGQTRLACPRCTTSRIHPARHCVDKWEPDGRAATATMKGEGGPQRTQITVFKVERRCLCACVKVGAEIDGQYAGCLILSGIP